MEVMTGRSVAWVHVLGRRTTITHGLHATLWVNVPRAALDGEGTYTQLPGGGAGGDAFSE